jgi:hypothetical protein
MGAILKPLATKDDSHGLELRVVRRIVSFAIAQLGVLIGILLKML